MSRLMSLYLRIVAFVLLLVVASVLVSGSCAALNEASDFSVACGVLGLALTAAVVPWLAAKILGLKLNLKREKSS